MIASTRELALAMSRRHPGAFDPGPGPGAWHRCDGAAGLKRSGAEGERDPGPRLRVLCAVLLASGAPRDRFFL